MLPTKVGTWCDSCRNRDKPAAARAGMVTGASSVESVVRVTDRATLPLPR